MVGRPLRTLVLTTLLSLGNLAALHAEPLPAPTVPLKDFDGRGVIQIELPPSHASTDPNQIETGLMTWIAFRQAYVRPDKMLLELSMGRSGPSQISVATGNVERIYSRGANYKQERIYRNLETSPQNPMTTVQTSMATYARILREIDTGKVLPDEEFDRLETEHKARIEELNQLRMKLATSKDPKEISRVSEAAAEMARRHDDLTQIPFRRTHPCVVMEYPNKDVLQKLFANNVTGSAGLEVLGKGKTRVWVTRAEGLPIKIETTSNEGRVALSLVFTRISINSGLHPGELALDAPLTARTLTVTADLKDPKWQEKMDDELGTQVSRLQNANRPQATVAPVRKKK